jgi:hypothetical protein
MTFQFVNIFTKGLPSSTLEVAPTGMDVPALGALAPKGFYPIYVTHPMSINQSFDPAIYHPLTRSYSIRLQSILPTRNRP